MDKKLQKILEPGAIYPNHRINMLKKFRKQTNASLGLHLMSILGHIPDRYETLDLLFKNMRFSNVH